MSEVNFSDTSSNKDFRTDSDFWTKQPKLNPLLVYDKIGNCIHSAQYGISIEMNEEQIGYPIYRMNEIHNMLCDFEVNKYAAITKEELQVFKLNDGDVLFNRTNSYEWVGRTGVYKKSGEKDFVFASYLVRFVTDKSKVLPEYLAAFLSTKFGVWDIKRRSRRSINQTNVNPEEVKLIDIPLLSLSFQLLIKQCFDDATVKLKSSQMFYFEAENILLKKLGLENWEPTSKNTNEKSIRESFLESGRLDSEYYQPKHDELRNRLVNTGESVRLGAYLSFNKRGTQPIYTEDETGIPVLNSKHIRENRIEFTDNRFGMPSQTISMLLIRKNDVLINGTGVGTIGRSAVYLRDEPSLPDNHVTILRTKGLDPVFLSVQLNSIIGKLQVEKYCKGSSGQIELYPADINEFVIWKGPSEVQANIRTTIEESENLRNESEALLKLAKNAVEMAIEHGEKEAIAYINQNAK